MLETESSEILLVTHFGMMTSKPKRERPNSYTLTFSVKDKLGDDCIKTTDVVEIEQYTIDNKSGTYVDINPT